MEIFADREEGEEEARREIETANQRVSDISLTPPSILLLLLSVQQRDRETETERQEEREREREKRF